MPNVFTLNSERLATAWGFLKLPVGKSIIVKKNLRVCEDCHQAIKFISSLEKRDIHLRDTSRWHYFKDGKCSCNDEW
jgi:hypothetical protein